MLDPGRTRSSLSIQNCNHHPSNDDDRRVQTYQPARLSCDSYVSHDDIRDYGNRVRKSAEYYAKFRQSWSGPLIADEQEAEFGFSTPPPPLWAATSSPPRGNNSNHYRNLSPASKAQAIARGQRELMEMVSKMPESCYELSLKDLVEKQPLISEEKQDVVSVQEQEKKRIDKNKKMEIVKKNNGNFRSNNNKKNSEGFLLKMVFPLAFGTKKNVSNNNSKKKKKKSDTLVGAYSLKVAPKPPPVPVVEGSDKSVDKEWWRKRFEKSESESSRCSSSSNHGSGKSSLSSNSSCSLSRNDSTSRDERGGGGCLPFSFKRNKNSKNGQ